jgi:succinoglycan biosynthesis protein ExoV
MINHYERIEGGNFGDDLNATMWDRLLPKPLSQYLNEDTFFIGIGTRLRPKNIPKGKRIIVFGSGFGYSDEPPTVDENWDIRCVRGPLTAKALNLDLKLAITDSAILCKNLYTKGEPRYRVSFVPHHLTLSADNWEKFCGKVNIHLIDPRSHPDLVIDQIIHSNLVIAESLHAAIIADTFRIPWIPVKTRETIFDFKWNDWAESMNLQLSFKKLIPLCDRRIENRDSIFRGFLKQNYGRYFSSKLAKRDFNFIINSKYFLSDDDVFELRYKEMESCLKIFIQDLEN